MSELEALSDAPGMVEMRMVETGEVDATDGIDSLVPHSPGSLATHEASETASRAGAAAESGIGTPSQMTVETRQKAEGASNRTIHLHVAMT